MSTRCSERLLGQGTPGYERGGCWRRCGGILAAAGQAVPEPRERSFVCEGEVLERALKKALADRDEALRDLAAAARWVDRSAFGKEEGFGQAHQSLLKALDKASQFV